MTATQTSPYIKTFGFTVLLALASLAHMVKASVPQQLGIGFVVATNPYQYEDGSHYKNFYADKDFENKWTGKVLPFFYKPDYALYHFICLEKSDTHYKILVNDKSTVYVPNDAAFHFKSWEMILVNASVVRLTHDNPVRDRANSSRIIPYKCQSGQLQVNDAIEMNGEYWIQVSFSPTCEDVVDQFSPRTYGWIKWRTRDKLLVNILLLC